MTYERKLPPKQLKKTAALQQNGSSPRWKPPRRLPRPARTKGQHSYRRARSSNLRKTAKADYEERMASTARGREGREMFRSLKGKRKKRPSSSTSREKARNKLIMIIMASKRVRGEGGAVLAREAETIAREYRGERRLIKLAADTATLTCDLVSPGGTHPSF